TDSDGKQRPAGQPLPSALPPERVVHTTMTELSQATPSDPFFAPPFERANRLRRLGGAQVLPSLPLDCHRDNATTWSSYEGAIFQCAGASRFCIADDQPHEVVDPNAALVRFAGTRRI